MKTVWHPGSLLWHIPLCPFSTKQIQSTQTSSRWKMNMTWWWRWHLSLCRSTVSVKVQFSDWRWGRSNVADIVLLVVHRSNLFIYYTVVWCDLLLWFIVTYLFIYLGPAKQGIFMITVNQWEVSNRQDNKLKEVACYGGNKQLNKIIAYRLKKKEESPAPGFHAE